MTYLTNDRRVGRMPSSLSYKRFTLSFIIMDQINLTEELGKIFTGFKNNLVELIPQLIISLIVLVIGYLVARLAKYLIIRFVRYLNRLIKQKYEKANIAQSASFLGTAVYWLILFSTFLLITDILDIRIVTEWLDSLLRYSPNVLAAILIIFIALILGRMLADILSNLGSSFGLTYGKTLGKIVQYLILVTAIIIAIDQIGIEVAFLIHLIDIVLAALLFGAALAFGLGARSSVSNILASFYIRKMYEEGDRIRIDETEGQIIKIDATMVVLTTESGRVVIPAKDFNDKQTFLISK